MQEIIMATHNLNKVNEVRDILTNYQLLSLHDLEVRDEIPETGKTLFENALLKVKAIYKITGKSCLADDTGLEVNALGGDPGVFSARYAGENSSSTENINKLLEEMKGHYDRSATFRTILAYMNEYGQYRFFEGVVEGTITESPLGESGFGYDSVFKPIGYDMTFAQMPVSLKNEISHRKRALVEFQKYFEVMQIA
jgi:XTP/dITP diphosphohydrolase